MKYMSLAAVRFTIAFLLVPLSAANAFAQPASQPTTQPAPRVLLELRASGNDPAKIDYAKLPEIKGTHAIVCAPDGVLKFQLHSYLAHYDGKFWCMWSQGPPVEDEPSQHVRYATSDDGLKWSEPKTLVAPAEEGRGYIARDFWIRDGELLALAAHFKGKGAFGVDKELRLEALGWDKTAGTWKPKGVLFDNAINNFAPEKLPSGEWMTTRRDPRFNVYMLIGGKKSFDDWQSIPVVKRLEIKGFLPDEPIWWPQPDGKLVALFRDNSGTARLFHSTSTDNGRTWTPPEKTNYPNATSKLFSLKTSRGYRVLISNANPTLGRRELHLAISQDGNVFTALGKLNIPMPRASTLQYPNAIEHDGCLFITYSRNKATIEVLKVSLEELETLRKK
jgi:hypothetical protein